MVGYKHNVLMIAYITGLTPTHSWSLTDLLIASRCEVMKSCMTSSTIYVGMDYTGAVDCGVYFVERLVSMSI